MGKFVKGCLFAVVSIQFVASMHAAAPLQADDRETMIIRVVKGTSIVGNKGKKHGITLGMVFNLRREGHIYGKAEVLVVKQSACGLKVQEILEGYTPRVKDELELYPSTPRAKGDPVSDQSAVETYALGSTGFYFSESNLGLSLIIGLRSAFGRFGLSVNPADLGLFPEKNQDSRYRKETFSNGRTVCRDLQNGQFVDSEKCEGSIRAIYAFSVDATYKLNNSDLPIYLGIGYRLANKPGIYLASAITYALEQKRMIGFLKTHIGASLLIFSAGFRFRL